MSQLKDPEIIKLIQEMIQAGMTNGEISSLFRGKISSNIIYNYRKKMQEEQNQELANGVSERNISTIKRLIEKSIERGYTQRTDKVNTLLKLIDETGMTPRGKVYTPEKQRREKAGVQIHVSPDVEVYRIREERQRRIYKSEKQGEHLNSKYDRAER